MHSQSLVVHLESPFSAYDPKGAPARDVVLMGLKWDTPFWPELAVGWLEQGLPVDAEIAACLQSLVERAKWPQQLRHRAQVLLRTRRRSE